MSKNKVVIVTGGARGIGEGIVKKFARNHNHVLIHYHKSHTKAQELYKALKNEGCSVELFKADVTKRQEVNDMMEYCIEKFGALDILINNAGIAQDKLFTDLTDEDWDQMMNTNLKSVFYCTQKALSYMISQKSGKIINISSIWGMVGGSCEVHYSTAKAGVIGMTKALAKEVGPSNIQINSIAPGVIQTNMLDEYSEEDLDDLCDQTPLMRLGTPEDIASCAFFLASQGGDFITGQVISPNGGFVIS